MPTMTSYSVMRSHSPSVRGLSHKRQGSREHQAAGQVWEAAKGLCGGLSHIPRLTNKNSCGATPPHNSGLNKPVVRSRVLWIFNGAEGLLRESDVPCTQSVAGQNEGS